jgi:hypothetical protein
MQVQTLSMLPGDSINLFNQFDQMRAPHGGGVQRARNQGEEAHLRGFKRILVGKGTGSRLREQGPWAHPVE